MSRRTISGGVAGSLKLAMTCLGPKMSAGPRHGALEMVKFTTTDSEPLWSRTWNIVGNTHVYVCTRLKRLFIHQ